MTAASAQALLAGIVDYAGLFPPAALPMEGAVTEYARRRRSPEGWMVGRFVLPAARLGEMMRAADAVLPDPGDSEPWRLSALLGGDARGDGALVESFNGSRAGRAVADSVELRAASPDEAGAALDAVPAGLAAFVEVPLDRDLPALVAVLKARGARAKVRTGGVVPEAIPGPSDLARFIVACAEAAVPFKATAGLHHPVRGGHALTDEPGAPRALMHGFLNVFGAAALAREGASAPEVEDLLREEDQEAFRFEPDGLRWRERTISTAALLACRRSFAASFGSCSIAEPVADLVALGVLAPADGLAHPRGLS